MAEWVRSGALEGAWDLIGELGGDPARLAAEAGVDAAALRDPDFPVPIEAFVRFLEQAARACDCPSLGLRLSLRQELTLFGPLWPLLRACRTLEDRLTRLAEIFPLHTQGAQISIERDREGLWTVYDLAAGAGGGQRQTMELGFGILVSECRRVAPLWRPPVTQFRHAAPADRALHERIFGQQISFDADRNALLVDAAILRLPLPDAESAPARAAPSNAPLSRAFANRVEIAVRALLPFGDCALADVARALDLTGRTLQRRLSKEGTSFADVRDRVRAALAFYYVSDSGLSAAAIAEILQFSQTSALSRAFRRWHGARLSAVRTGARAVKVRPGA